MPKHEISNVRTRGTGAIEKLIFYKTEVSEHQQADQAPFYVSRSIRYQQNASERISGSVQTKRWRTSTSLS